MLRIFIAESNPDLRVGLQFLINQQPGLQVTGIAVNGNDLIKINGHFKNRLPNTLSISFYVIESNTILSQINKKIAASAGSACHSGGVHISDILNAMNVQLEYATGTLRLSTGKMTTEKEIDKSVEIIVKAVKEHIK